MSRPHAEPRPVLAAPDAFKGTLRAAEVAAALVRGLRGAGIAAEPCPIADGGEGTAEALIAARGGEEHDARARDPLGRPVPATFALLDDGETAVVEVASASGPHLVAPVQRNAEAACTAGTGDLILAAIEGGARHVLVAAGGSATTDGGEGAIGAIVHGGGLRGARLTVLCDVRTPWELAAERFGPQKGADPAAVRRLARRLDILADRLPRDPRRRPLTGAAGGLSGGLWAALHAVLEPGAAYVLDAIGFDERMRAAHAVVVGEGRLDETTLQGKALWEAAVRCRQAGVPCFAVVGTRDLDDFGARLLDLQAIHAASTPQQIQAAVARIVPAL